MLQRLVAMNMPLKPDGTVTFTATLFAVIRTSLRIKMEGSIDNCNRELKAIVQKIWKRAPDSVLDAIFPPAGTGENVRVFDRAPTDLSEPYLLFSAFGVYEHASQFRRVG
jgi:hypothetical protein